MQPDHRRLHRARDRRRGQGQHMDAPSELTQPGFLLRSEALLLVDDEEAEIAEPHLLAAYGMRPDDDLHIARRETFSRCSRIGRRGQPGERLDPNPEPGETAS